MAHEEHDFYVNPSSETVPLDREETVVAPRFDEKSVQRARPAVPLRERYGRRAWPFTIIVLCVIASVAGGVLGAIVLSMYQKGDARVESTAGTTPARPQPPAANPNDAAGATNADAPAEKTESQTPAETAAGASEPQPSSESSGESRTAARQDVPARERSTSGGVPVIEAAGERVADGEAQAELRGALGEWVAATNARDIQRQMGFYAPTVNSFYLTRNASREAVRAEKSRAFAGADSVDVRAGEPDIRVSEDGRTAVMRFRKKYAIEGGGAGKRGEVLQELRWRRTPDGWKIVGERDLRVIQ